MNYNNRTLLGIAAGGGILGNEIFHHFQAKSANYKNVAYWLMNRKKTSPTKKEDVKNDTYEMKDNEQNLKEG